MALYAHRECPAKKRNPKTLPLRAIDSGRKMRYTVFMRYKMLALDLDGTLTDNQKRITPRTKESLFAAMDCGVKIVLASGRPDLGITALAKELELYRRGGYILAFNGGRIIDCKQNAVISETHVDPAFFDAILACKQLFPGVEVLTYSEREILTERVNDYVKEEARCLSAPIHTVPNLKEALPPSVVKFLIVGEHDALLPVQSHLASVGAGKISAYFSQPFFLEVTPCGIDKAASLTRLAAHCGFQKEELMACGDGYNDIPMLDAVGMPVAMENAYPEVKPHAKFITRSNEEDGVAYAVETLILGKQGGER